MVRLKLCSDFLCYVRISFVYPEYSSYLKDKSLGKLNLVLRDPEHSCFPGKMTRTERGSLHSNEMPVQDSVGSSCLQIPVVVFLSGDSREHECKVQSFEGMDIVSSFV